MKKYIFTLFAIALIISCRKESNIITYHNAEIINNTSHSVKITKYDSQDTIEIDSAQFYTFSYQVQGDAERNRGFFEGFGDSLRITYNDTLNVYHGSKRYNVARDARNALFYTHSQTQGEDIHYYKYTLTNTDFNEAVMIGDSL